jgi:hypothetical protein
MRSADPWLECARSAKPKGVAERMPPGLAAILGTTVTHRECCFQRVLEHVTPGMGENYIYLRLKDPWF